MRMSAFLDIVTCQPHVPNPCVETYENMTNVRNDVWWSQNTRLVQRKTKRTLLGRVNFAPRVGPLRNCHG